MLESHADHRPMTGVTVAEGRRQGSAVSARNRPCPSRAARGQWEKEGAVPHARLTFHATSDGEELLAIYTMLHDNQLGLAVRKRASIQIPPGGRGGRRVRRTSTIKHVFTPIPTRQMSTPLWAKSRTAGQFETIPYHAKGKKPRFLIRGGLLAKSCGVAFSEIPGTR